MNSESLISKAKELVAKGEADKARDLLLEEGFTARLDPEIQAVYPHVILPSKQLQDLLDGPLKLLKDKSPTARYRGADMICKEALKEYSVHRKISLGDPRTTGPLIEALDDTDPKVVEKAAAALGAILRRYFPDIRAFKRLTKLLKSPKKKERLYAVLGIGALGHEERWPLLLKMFDDRAGEVVRGVCRSLLDFLPDSGLDPVVTTKLIAQLKELIPVADNDTRPLCVSIIRKLERGG
jgi:hypothetical protein